jgi:hypothetical protein
MNRKHVLNHRPDEDAPDAKAKARFGTAIGSLMYLMIGTRPDIAFALSKLSRFTSRPQSHHQAALRQLLRYIKSTQSHRITYRSGQLIGTLNAMFKFQHLDVAKILVLGTASSPCPTEVRRRIPIPYPTNQVEMAIENTITALSLAYLP